MADPSTSSDKGKKDLEREFAERLFEARQQKIPFDIDMRESYFFAAPHRQRSVLSTTRPSKWKPQDSGELNQSFAFETCGDFPTVIQNTFMPEAADWVLRAAPIGTPPAQKVQAEEKAKEGTSEIFKSIATSNFYAEFAKSANPDLAIGTIAMWVDNGRPGQPRKCQSIPIRELEINLDGEGMIDDRFVCRWMRRRYVKRIFKDVELPKKVMGKPRQNEEDRIPVVWGFWRVYDDREEEAWMHAVTIDGEIVGEPTTIRGSGCCPLIVGRFNPGPEWAWGVGPMIQCLPEFRNLDELASGKIRNLDQMLQPSLSWPDDSFANIEGGLESGMAYPIRPGTAGDIKNIYTPNPPDAAIYDRQDLEQRIKRLFFLDWPQQRGDTPPTATQWYDEMAMAQRRIGTPALPFWKEFPAQIFGRFEYLMTEAGEIEKIEVLDANGQPRRLTMMPYNPAQKAQEQQDIASASRFLGLVMPTFPEEAKIAIDGTVTIKNLLAKFGVEKIIAMRDPDKVNAAIQQMTQLQGGQPGAVPDSAQQNPATGTPQPDLAGPAPAQPQYQLRSKSF